VWLQVEVRKICSFADVYLKQLRSCTRSSHDTVPKHGVILVPDARSPFFISQFLRSKNPSSCSYAFGVVVIIISRQPDRWLVFIISGK